MLAICADFTNFNKPSFSYGFKMKQTETGKPYDKGFFVLAGAGDGRFSIVQKYYTPFAEKYTAGLKAYNDLIELAKTDKMIHRKLDGMGLISNSFTEMFDFKIFRLTYSKEFGKHTLIEPRGGTNDLLINVRVEDEESHYVRVKSSNQPECLVRFCKMTTHDESLGRNVQTNRTENLYKLRRGDTLYISRKPVGKEGCFERHVLRWEPRNLIIEKEVVDLDSSIVVSKKTLSNIDHYNRSATDEAYYNKIVTGLLTLHELCSNNVGV